MRAQVNGIEIEYETMGDPADPPLLMVHGLGCQLNWTPAGFLHGLVDRGFYVIVYDNRDVGLSTKIPTNGDPTEQIGMYLEGKPTEAAYQIADMAADGWGLLDALGIERAHIVGASMGGMIVQQMAIANPDRTISLTSIMSTTGSPDVGQPTAEAMGVLLEPAAQEREAYIEQAVRASAVLAGPVHFEPDWIRERAAMAFDRSFYPQGVANQLLAIVSSPPRDEHLAELDLPALVIHGDIDPLVTISGGERTAECLQRSEFLVLEDMGHDLPKFYWSTMIENITSLAVRSRL